MIPKFLFHPTSGFAKPDTLSVITWIGGVLGDGWLLKGWVDTF